MAEGKSHKTASNRIAKRYGVEYNNGKGIDISSTRAAIEVETETTVASGIRQLQGHRKPAYIAGANHRTVQIALEKTEGTTIGVMDNQGNIVKSSTRKR